MESKHRSAPEPVPDPLSSSGDIDARLTKLESRMAHQERRLFDSQMLVARKLGEIFKSLKQHQHLRDAKMHESLGRLVTQLADLKARLDPVVSPTITH